MWSRSGGIGRRTRWDVPEEVDDGGTRGLLSRNPGEAVQAPGMTAPSLAKFDLAHDGVAEPLGTYWAALGGPQRQGLIPT